CRRLAALSCRRSRRACISPTAIESGGQSLVGEGGANDCSEDFMQVGDALNRISESLFVDLGVFRLKPIADRAVGYGRKFDVHGYAPETTPRLAEFPVHPPCCRRPSTHSA